jgi:hypothetical protein
MVLAPFLAAEEKQDTDTGSKTVSENKELYEGTWVGVDASGDGYQLILRKTQANIIHGKLICQPRSDSEIAQFAGTTLPLSGTQTGLVLALKHARDSSITVGMINLDGFKDSFELMTMDWKRIKFSRPEPEIQISNPQPDNISGLWKSGSGNVIKIQQDGKQYTGTIISVENDGEPGTETVGDIVMKLQPWGNNVFHAQIKFEGDEKNMDVWDKTRISAVQDKIYLGDELTDAAPAKGQVYLERIHSKANSSKEVE